ncbi:MAG TPA: N-acetylglucosamine-6-phosphate deacetylase [Acidobacteriaceae bacterium]|nr:N-acetylglucosamine-6-phosphate deacetylase [Acidobacteriaceae bacterium]
MQIVLTAAECITSSTRIPDPVVFIEDGRIAGLASRTEVEIPPNAQLVDLSGATLLPAFVDVHIHGSAGHDVMEATPSALSTIGKFLASRGVVAFLATTVTASVDKTLASVENLANLIEGTPPDAQARPIGLHLEGPFISHQKRGVHPPTEIQPPSTALFNRFWQASRGHIKLMTIAPETPGAIELIQHAASLGVALSLGHSDADTAQSLAGISAGARSFTHTFNAMRRLDHRDPGITAAALGLFPESAALYSELICDGIHVHPAMVRLWHNSKRRDRAVLITDAISATGKPDGDYMLGDLKVQVAEGRCMYQGKLAGSVLTMDRAVANLRSYTGAPAAELALAASTNPARLIGASQKYGELAPGRNADIAAVSAEGKLIASFIAGQQMTY